MAEEKNTNKIIGLVLVVIILIAIFTIINVNLPEEVKNNEEIINDENELIFSFKFGNEITNYSIQDLETLEEFSGQGTIIKTGWLPDVVLEGPFNLSGIKVTTILNEFDNLPYNFTIKVHSSDGWTTDYNQSTIMGKISIYNDSGNITQTGGVTMILAYKQDGVYIKDTNDGPLRIAFVDDGKITSSKLWAKMVVSFELIEQ
jgi:hypothetical protein